MSTINNPHSQRPPDGFVNQIHDFAYDLAWGVEQGLWDGIFDISRFDNATKTRWKPKHSTAEASENLLKLLNTKWRVRHPDINHLMMYGYLIQVEDDGVYFTREDGYRRYSLTPAAFALLHKPATPPDVFISYARLHSSAFALLIESRLKNVGVNNPFIDKNIAGGAAWKDAIEQGITECKYIVCLIAPSTFATKGVKQELDFALSLKRELPIIHLCHSGMTLKDCYALMPQLQPYNGYAVPEESAFHYEAAVNFALNAMRLKTYG